jgi:hypothetical protein
MLVPPIVTMHVTKIAITGPIIISAFPCDFSIAQSWSSSMLGQPSEKAIEGKIRWYTDLKSGSPWFAAIFDPLCPALLGASSSRLEGYCVYMACEHLEHGRIERGGFVARPVP